MVHSKASGNLAESYIEPKPEVQHVPGFQKEMAAIRAQQAAEKLEEVKYYDNPNARLTMSPEEKARLMAGRL